MFFVSNLQISLEIFFIILLVQRIILDTGKEAQGTISILACSVVKELMHRMK